MAWWTSLTQSAITLRIVMRGLCCFALASPSPLYASSQISREKCGNTGDLKAYRHLIHEKNAVDSGALFLYRTSLITLVIFRMLRIPSNVAREHEATHTTLACGGAVGGLSGCRPLLPISISCPGSIRSKSKDSEQSDASLSRLGPQAANARHRQDSGRGCV